MTTLPKQPPLPEPTIVDNRRLFTTGDMREHARVYGQQCFQAGMQFQPFEPDAAPQAPRSNTPTSDLFKGIFPWAK